MENTVDWRIEKPFTAIAFGYSGSGKNRMCHDLINQFQHVTNSTTPLKRIMIFHQTDETQYNILKKPNIDIELYRGIPTHIIEAEEEFWKSEHNQIVIFDDVTQFLTHKNIVNFWMKLTTVISRRENLSIIFILHSLFLSQIAPLRRNVRYIFVFRNNLQHYRSLGREFDISNLPSIADRIFNQLHLYYFIIDSRSNSNFRVFTGILEHETPLVYNV